MWFSGLRGAIAFALAIDSEKHFHNGDMILLMTLLYAIISILLVGGAIAPILVKLDVMEKHRDEYQGEAMEGVVEVKQMNCFKRLKRCVYYLDARYITPMLVKNKKYDEKELNSKENSFSEDYK